MAKISLLFVEKLTNSELLPAFPTSIRKILAIFLSPLFYAKISVNKQ